MCTAFPVKFFYTLGTNVKVESAHNVLVVYVIADVS